MGHVARHVNGGGGEWTCSTSTILGGDDPRERGDDRPDISRGSRAGGDPRELRPVDPRDVFTERLDLPRGDARGRVRVRDREYDLRGSESRTLATIGADGHVHFPDVRIEYQDFDGRTRHEDIEVETMHYRGAHGAAAARSGFSRYGGRSARICVSCGGGGRRGSGAPGT
jgi:hypothetical protein